MFKNSALRDLSPIYAYLVVSGIAWGMPDLVLPLFATSLGVSVEEWGILISIFAVGMFSFEAFVGLVSDKIGRRTTLLLSTIGLSVIFPLYALKFVQYFAILQFFRGILGVIMAPTSRSYISENATPKQMGIAMGLWWATFSLGRTIGSIMGSTIVKIWGYEYAFYVCSILALVGMLFSLRVKSRSKRRKQDEDSTNVAKHQNFKSKGPSVFGLSRSTGILFLLAFTTMSGFTLLTSFLPLFLSEGLGMPILEIGFVAGTFSAVSVVATPLMGRISDRVGREKMVIAGSGLFGIALIGYAFSNNVYYLMLVTAVVSVGLYSVMPCTLAILADRTPSHRSGLIMGLYGTFEDLAGILAPLLYSYIWIAFGANYILYSCAGIQVLGMVFGFTLSRLNNG
jgi:DHA1 family multidrug resistance protein-like MFS transporter